MYGSETAVFKKNMRLRPGREYEVRSYVEEGVRSSSTNGNDGVCLPSRVQRYVSDTLLRRNYKLSEEKIYL